MKCIVIDDEPMALDLIKSYIAKTPFLESGECFTNPYKAVDYLIHNKIDLVFLDINMPELSGIQLLKSLPFPPQVIFTTAYPEFAAESYEYNAVDYLLKPVRFERFLKAVNKAAGLSKTANDERKEGLDSSGNNEYLYIKSGTRLIKVRPSDILYVEGAGNYMTFYTTDKKIMSLLTMQEVLDMLSTELFVRIHKSYLISLQHIDAIEKHDVIINGKQIPIGMTYREQFLSIINKHGR